MKIELKKYRTATDLLFFIIVSRDDGKLEAE